MQTVSNSIHKCIFLYPENGLWKWESTHFSHVLVPCLLRNADLDRLGHLARRDYNADFMADDIGS